jgi:replicative DNA helicase
MKTPCTDQQLEREFVALMAYVKPEALAPNRVPPHEITDPKCATVAAVIYELVRDGSPTGWHDITERLEKTGRLHDAGGYDGLSSIQSADLHTDIGPLARRLRAIAAARRLREATVRATAMCEAGQLEEARAGLLGALEASTSESESFKLMHAGEVAYEAIDHLTKGSGRGQLQTGVGLLDDAIGGYGPGNMLTIGGRTGAGKSSLMLLLAIRAVEAGKRVGIISLEDAPNVWGTRLVSHLTGVNGSRLSRRHVDAGEIERAAGGIMAAADMGLHFSFAISRPVEDIQEAATRMVRDHGCECIMVDYIQRVRVSAGRTGRLDHAYGQAASDLKGHCARLDVPLVLGSQVGRPDKGNPFKEPSINELKESGDLENSSEVIMLLWRKSDEPTAETFGKIGKIKWAPSGQRFQLRRDPYSGQVNDCIRPAEEAPQYA